MRQRLAVFAVAAAWPSRAVRAALAQEHEGAEKQRRAPKKPRGFAEKHELELKWANFLLLAGLLGYTDRQECRTVFHRAFGRHPQGHGRIPPPAPGSRSQGRRRGSPPRQPREGNRRPPRQSETEAKAETERMAQHTDAEIAKIQVARRTGNRLRRQGRADGVEALLPPNSPWGSPNRRCAPA